MNGGLELAAAGITARAGAMPSSLDHISHNTVLTNKSTGWLTGLTGNLGQHGPSAIVPNAAGMFTKLTGLRFDRLFNLVLVCRRTIRTLGLKPAWSLVFGEVEIFLNLLLASHKGGEPLGIFKGRVHLGLGIREALS